MRAAVLACPLIQVKRYLESHGLEDPNAGKLSLEDVKQKYVSS